MSSKMIDGAMVKEYLFDVVADIASFVEQVDEVAIAKDYLTKLAMGIGSLPGN